MRIIYMMNDEIKRKRFDAYEAPSKGDDVLMSDGVHRIAHREWVEDPGHEHYEEFIQTVIIHLRKKMTTKK